MTKGEDVYALQTALVDQGFSVGNSGADGYFGNDTSTAVKAFQKAHGLVVDGIAGGKTQKLLSNLIGARVADKAGVPVKRVYGQTEHESSDWLGIYSAQYPNGSYDAGDAQMNTGLTPPQDGFNVPKALTALASRIKHYYDHFAGLPEARRWDLAQGTWNAPAWACYIAKQEGATQVTASETAKPTDAQRQQLESYIAAVSVYA
jgi:peptidoglycan hydrolase-like protein with peptidoglycan-binding domain